MVRTLILRGSAAPLPRRGELVSVRLSTISTTAATSTPHCPVWIISDNQCEVDKGAADADKASGTAKGCKNRGAECKMESTPSEKTLFALDSC